jgi:hypothetical protein
MKKLFIILFVATTFVACKNESNTTAKGKVASTDSRKPANEIEVNIYRSGDSMMQAFKNKDWPTFAQYNHPSMIKMMGGRDAFIDLLSKQMAEIPDTSIKSIAVGKILQVVKAPEDHQCVIEQNMLMEMEGMRITSTTYLVGESADGKSWTFFDASNGGIIKPTDIKPNLSLELRIPEKKQDIKPIETISGNKN